MRITASVAAAAALALATPTVAAAAFKPRVNGWYPCALSTEAFTEEQGTSFECAEIEVPLCYDGVCESEQFIDVFVKRRLATNRDNGTAPKAVIYLQGGPGGSSTQMEFSIDHMRSQLDDNADFYTIDHRGTGRSEFLECDAAQALTLGSPDGKELSLREMNSCITDLNFKYNGQAAGFSTTSVAMDVRTMIETFMEKQGVFVYGFSYGTFLAQRVMQLDIPQVKGYVFDGVDALSVEGDSIVTANSHWNQAMAAPSRRLLEYCYDDKQCKVEFKSRETVVEDTLAFMDKLDADATTNACAKILAKGSEGLSPSDTLRMWKFEKVMSFTTQSQALTMLARVQRCSSDDIEEMEKAFQDAAVSESDTDEAAVVDRLNDISMLLYNTIVYSERWAQPGPTRKERAAFLHSTPIGIDPEDDARHYCMFTGSTEPACQELEDELPANRTSSFFYKRDKYFNMPLKLPDHASAVVFTGGLDFQTPREFGELLYSKLKGSGQGVMMVNFDYGTHCWGGATATEPVTPCRDAIVTGFIKQNGDVAKINTQCMADLPTAVFH